MINRRLLCDAIDRIVPSSVHYKEFDSNGVQLIINTWQMFFQQQKRFNFDDERSMTDDVFKTLTSLSKQQFNDLIDQISYSDIRNSSNRSVRTAIAILLCKLRLGLSNQLLAILFQLPNKRTVARSIESARRVLMADFIPNNVGFGHVSRNEIIHQHTSSIAQKLFCDDNPDTAVVVADGTYLFIQVNKIQSFTWPYFSFLSNRNHEATNSKGGHIIFRRRDHCWNRWCSCRLLATSFLVLVHSCQTFPTTMLQLWRIF